MKKYFIILSSLSLIFFSCSETTIGPKLKPPKNPFEMTWTADTIAYQGSAQTVLNSIWASSPNDVWICGHNDRSRGEIYHYDGKNWNEIDPMNDVPRSPKSMRKVTGLSTNNIWMIGNREVHSWKSLILNFNGTKWIEHNLNLQVRTMALFANNEKDIWVGCDSAVILNYNGSTWVKDKLKLNIPAGAEYFIKSIVTKDGYVYSHVFVQDDVKKRYLFYLVKGTVKNWLTIDSMEVANPQSIIKWGNWGLHVGKDNCLYSYGDLGVWEFIDNKWVRTIPIPYTMLSVYTLSNNYKFAVGVMGMVWFNDGSSWKQMTQFYRDDASIHMLDVWTDGQEVFLLANTTGAWPQKTIVYRGK